MYRFYIGKHDDGDSHCEVALSDEPEEVVVKSLKEDFPSCRTIEVVPLGMSTICQEVCWGEPPAEEELQAAFEALMLIDQANKEGRPMVQLLEGIASFMYNLARGQAAQAHP